MVAGDPGVVVSRLKREDCKHTKHDRHFSRWEILVGPSDWEDHSLGKEGAERYRVHNLPKNSGPGVYELGIAVSRTGFGREIGKLIPERIVVVYLGQADSVRTRLQRYGRSGAHLGNSYSSGFSIDSKEALQKGPGLFEEILLSGYPIVFRWAPMPSKSDAIRIETQLLNTFDYAWNTSINGSRRPNDILQKLKKISSSTTHFYDSVLKLVPFSQKQVGIRIEARKSPSTEDKFNPPVDEESHNFLSRVFKFGRSQPRLVLDRSTIPPEDRTTICGVVLGHDSICRRPPVEGRKRCADHKGMRVKGTVKVEISNSNEDSKGVSQVTVNYLTSESFTPTCGFILADGSPCKSQPIKGNKRCIEHKGRRIRKPNFVLVQNEKIDHLLQSVVS